MPNGQRKGALGQGIQGNLQWTELILNSSIDLDDLLHFEVSQLLYIEVSQLLHIEVSQLLHFLFS